MNEILDKLSSADLRSEGRAEEVAREVVDNPALLPALAEGLYSEDKLIRGRTCMAMEVISREQADLLAGTVPQLVELASRATVSQVKWHIAEVFANIPISGADGERIIPILLQYLDDRSRIVKHCAVQALGVLGKMSPRRTEIASRISPVANESKSLAKAVHRALQSLKDSEVDR